MILPENLHSGACIPLHPPSYPFIIEMVHPRTGKQSFTLHAFYILWISDFTFKLYTHKQENIPSNKRVKQSEELQMTVFNVFSLLGGLALFLFGMDIMGKALEKQAGGQLQKILSKLTDNPLKGFFLGLCVTAVIQSSSATTVMVVGFVNSGIMELHQAIGVIMGSNVGTTVTSWILSLSGLQGDSLLINLLKPTSFSPLLAFIGILLYMCKSEKKKGVGTILIGFAVLMTGMTTMSNAVLPLQNETWFTSLFTRFSNPLLGVLVGALVTGIIQSSSASVGILQALSATGVITYGSAIPIIMGQNIGTCVTALLSSVGANKNARRAAMVHLYFNIIGSVILLALVYAVQFTIGIPMWGDVMNKSSIANIHTLSSVCAMLLFLPCSSVLSKLAMLTVPDSAEEAQELSMPVLDERLFKSPAVALQQAKNAVVKMSRRAARNVTLATPLLLKMDEDVVSAIDVRENLIDRMEVDISNYLIKLADQELGDAESHEVTELLNFVTECERIGDYAVNIKEKAQELTDKEVTFSEKAQQELKLLDNALEKILTLTTDAFEFDDARTASQVEPLEQVIDILVERLRAQHIKRLKDGACSIDTGVVYLDVLNNVERISDHCSNIAARLVGMEAGEDYDSHTLKNMMHHNPTKEYMLNYEQCRKDYLIPLEQLEA